MQELRISELDLRPQGWHADLQRYVRLYAAVPVIIVGFLAAMFLLYYSIYSVRLGNAITDALMPGIIAFAVITGTASYFVKKIDAGKSKALRENLAYASHWQAAATPVQCDAIVNSHSKKSFVKITTRNSKTLYFKIVSINGSLYLGPIFSSPYENKLNNVAVRLDPFGMFAYLEIGAQRFWCLNHYPNADLQLAYEKTMKNQSYSEKY